MNVKLYTRLGDSIGARCTAAEYSHLDSWKQMCHHQFRFVEAQTINLHVMLLHVTHTVNLHWSSPQN